MDSSHSGAQSSGTGEGTPPPGGSGSVTNPKMRKRTKTGCLTCRKRRIKCGEERPTCANCIKSKRQCEGYNQRVVFKPPIGDWPNHPGVNTLQYHSSLLPGARASGFRGASSSSQEPSPSSIQPRPTEFDFSHVSTGPVPGQDHLSPLNAQGFARQYGQAPYQQPLHSPHHQQPLPSPQYQQPLHSPHHQLPTPTSATSYFPTPSPVHTNFQQSYTNDPSAGYQLSQRYPQGTTYQHLPVSHDTHIDQKPVVSIESNHSLPQTYQEQAAYQHHRGTTVAEEQSHYLLSSSVPARGDEYTLQAGQRPPLARYGSNPQLAVSQPQHPAVDLGHTATYTAPPYPDSTHSNFQNVQIPSHDVPSDVKYVPQHAVLEQPVAVSHAQQQVQPQLLLSGFGGNDHVSPTQVLDEAAVEYEDDDYYDVQSDEEMLDAEDNDRMISSRDLGLIQQLHRETSNDLSIRRYDALIYDGVLSHYRAEYVANPLRNPRTARVFAHFICVTGPSLSIYERNPRNPTSIFEGHIPPSQQSLWTYTLPLKALKHQGLLHAMLALASLHIAKLQKASVTPSYKHYAYAIKRLHRYLGHTKKRLQISTLATSLLLAFYEVMTAEHVKWNTHLVGAAQLLDELDFRSLTQEARRLKAEQTALEEQFPYQNPGMLIDQRQYEQRLKATVMMPDEALVSTIVGWKVSYDDFGKVVEKSNVKQEGKQGMPERLDLRSYETLQDLYWWSARQDAYQSVISGNPLTMDYRKWSDCPPRAPLGRTDALYGSHDHIMLLIGRIAEFTVRDRERKIAQQTADGGSWRPRPGMPGVGPPPTPGQGQTGLPPTPTTPMGPPPHLQGMSGAGAPPGWTGPPPAGWTGGPPPPQSQMSTTASQQPGQQEGQSQGQNPRGLPPSAAGPGFYGMAPSKPPAPLPRSYANPEPTAHSSPTSSASPGSPSSKFPDLPAAYEAALATWTSISHAHATMAQILTNTPSFQALPAEFNPPGPDGLSTTTPFGPALTHSRYDISIIWALLHLSKILLLRSHPAMPAAAMVASGVAAAATAPYAMLIGRITAGMQMPLGENAALTPALGAALIESTMPLFFAGVQFQSPQQREWLIERLIQIDRRTGWASAGSIARSCETSWEKAAELGRGPPYKRRTPRFGETGPVVMDPSSAEHSGNEGSGGGGGGWGGEGVVRSGGKKEWSEEDMRFVVKYPKGMVPWAMNILSTDEDLRVGMERLGFWGEINVAGTEREWRRS